MWNGDADDDRGHGGDDGDTDSDDDGGDDSDDDDAVGAPGAAARGGRVLARWAARAGVDLRSALAPAPWPAAAVASDSDGGGGGGGGGAVVEAVEVVVAATVGRGAGADFRIVDGDGGADLTLSLAVGERWPGSCGGWTVSGPLPPWARGRHNRTNAACAAAGAALAFACAVRLRRAGGGADADGPSPPAGARPGLDPSAVVGLVASALRGAGAGGVGVGVPGAGPALPFSGPSRRLARVGSGRLPRATVDGGGFRAGQREEEAWEETLFEAWCDYAHHPTAVAAVLRAVADADGSGSAVDGPAPVVDASDPSLETWVVFEPHSLSRSGATPLGRATAAALGGGGVDGDGRDGARGGAVGLVLVLDTFGARESGDGAAASDEIAARIRGPAGLARRVRGGGGGDAAVDALVAALAERVARGDAPRRVRLLFVGAGPGAPAAAAAFARRVAAAD